MTPEQAVEVDRLINFLLSDTRKATTAKRRETARRTLDSLLAMRIELDQLRVEVRELRENSANRL